MDRLRHVVRANRAGGRDRSKDLEGGGRHVAVSIWPWFCYYSASGEPPDHTWKFTTFASGYVAAEAEFPNRNTRPSSVTERHGFRRGLHRRSFVSSTTAERRWRRSARARRHAWWLSQTKINFSDQHRHSWSQQSAGESAIGPSRRYSVLRHVRMVVAATLTVVSVSTRRSP